MGTFVGDPLRDWLLVIMVLLFVGFGGLPLEAEAEAVVRMIIVL
jgi:hypothetical protein